VYEAGSRILSAVDLDAAVAASREGTDRFVWVGLFEPTMEELDSVATHFDLHPLAMEDAVHAHQRPKLEVYGDTVFVVLKTARYVDKDEIIELGEIMLFVSPRFVVSVRHGAGDLAALRATMEEDPERLRAGPSAVLHGVIDRVVDDYQRVQFELDEDIDDIESQVFAGGGRDHAERIFRLKREVLDFRRGVHPLIPAVEHLMERRVPVVDDALSHWFRDVHDHLLRVGDHLDLVDNLLDGALSANLAQVGVRQNEDMRKISAWVAIAAVPTMIAGVYGMNFEHMPELDTRYGYFVVVGLMLLACGGLYRNFKQRGWL
jgi:magnesium transporter